MTVFTQYEQSSYTRPSVEVPTVYERRVHVARHRDHIGNIDRMARDLAFIARAAVTVVGGGTAAVVAGILFRVVEAVTAGVWVVLVAGGFAAVLFQLESTFGKQAVVLKEVVDGVAGRHADDHRETDAMEVSDLHVAEGDVEAVHDEACGGNTGDALHGAPSLQVEDDRGGHRVDDSAVATQEFRVRHGGNRRTRQRFEMVRHTVATRSSRVPAFDNPSALTYLHRSNVERMTLVR